MKKAANKRDLYGGSKLQVDDTLSRSHQRENNVFKTGDNLTVNIANIHPADNNPRKLNIDDEIIEGFAQCIDDSARAQLLKTFEPNLDIFKKLTALFELGTSIRKTSLISPIVLRKAYLSGADKHRIDIIKPGDYVIISGERRWTAHRMFNITQASCLIRTEDEDGALAIRIEENLHREDLSREEYFNSIVMLKELDPNYGAKNLMSGIGLGKRMAYRLNSIVNCYIEDPLFKRASLETNLRLLDLEKLTQLSNADRETVIQKVLSGINIDAALHNNPSKKSSVKATNLGSKLSFKSVQSSHQLKQILIRMQPKLKDEIASADLDDPKSVKKIWNSVLSTLLEELE
jgi:hypothetical protein